jgi:hypothetical protein
VAIKGKSKARNRPKQVARAPRREPVEVKPPLFRRRWLQLTATFILGVLAMSVVVWVVSNLHHDHAKQQAADAASKRHTAALAWQGAVQQAFTPVGSSSQPGQVPVAFPAMTTALASMKKGTVPAGAGAAFAKVQKDAKDAAAAIAKFGVATQISDQGFTAQQALAFTDSSSSLVSALGLYENAAKAAALAADAPDAQRAQLVSLAQGLQQSGDQHLADAWATYEEALNAGGVVESPLGSTGGSGLGG